VWNTKRLLTQVSGAEMPAGIAVEYHLLSGRELYDKSIITADRYSSGAAAWVIRGDHCFYTVTVISQPSYRLPQELCLSFNCFTQTDKVVSSTGEFIHSGLPFEQVALEFTALLSVFAREPIIPLGLRRAGDQPIAGYPYYTALPRTARASTPPAYGIDSHEFVAILRGFARASDATAAAVLGAAKLYYAALSLVSFDPSVAYVSLVSAIECLAGHHYDKDPTFTFDTAQKFQGVGKVLNKIAQLPDGEPLSTQVKEKLVKTEHFVGQKFRRFIEGHPPTDDKGYLPDEFWNIPDELYKYQSVFPQITRSTLGVCLQEVYNARSKYVHGGKPFPIYVDFGLREEMLAEVYLQLEALRGKKRYIPPFAWFERVTHLAIVEYMRQSFAPELVRRRQEDLAEKERLLRVMAELPCNAQDSFKKLAQWTRQWLGAAMTIPPAPNKKWVDSARTVKTLLEAGLIEGEGRGLKGSSSLKSRAVGEAVGEFVFGIAANPFGGNELLLPDPPRQK
jgi:hypothetical protein